MRYKCPICEKEYDYEIKTKCGEYAKKNIQEIFRKNPELKQAYGEALDEAFSPENRKKMADDITKVMQAFQKIKGR